MGRLCMLNPYLMRYLADFQAGFCILTEAGGAVFGSKTSELTGEASADLMGEWSKQWSELKAAGRKYLVFRGLPDAEVSSKSVHKTKSRLIKGRGWARRSDPIHQRVLRGR